MESLYTSGAIVWLILAIMVAEGLALFVYHRMTGQGLHHTSYLANLLSGGATLLALGLVISGAWWGWIAISLFASFIAHSADMYRRLKRDQRLARLEDANHIPGPAE